MAGRLVASCRLTPDTRRTLRPLLTGTTDRARISTTAEIVDNGHSVVCSGTFDWSVRQLPRHS